MKASQTLIGVTALSTLALVVAGAPPASAGPAHVTGVATQNARQLSVRTDVRHEPLQWGPDVTGSGTEMIFRYRADGVASSPGKLVGTARTDSIERVAPLHSFDYLQLDGRTGAFVGASPITTRSQVGVTIEVWFRSQKHQYATLFSNLTADGGFALRDDNGRLRGDFVATGDGNRSVRHSIETRGTAHLDDGAWHVAAMTVGPDGSTASRTRLYLDNRQVANTSCITGSRTTDGSCRSSAGHGLLRNSTRVPAVGAQPDKDGTADGSRFLGQVNAVQVANWSIDHDVLSTPAPRDGGNYFGQPTDFDATPAVPESDGTSATKWSDRTWDLARREAWSDHGHPGSDTPDETAAINSGMSSVVARVGIGLLSDGYVPQGVSVSPDGRTMSVIYYYADDSGKNPAGAACGAQACPDVLVRTDLTTMRAAGIYLLNDTDGGPFGRQGSSFHANGLVDTHGYLYTSLATRRDPETHVVQGEVYRFDPSDAQLEAAGNRDFGIPPVYRLKPDASYPVASSGSAMSYAPTTDTMYLMGDYQPNSMATESNPDGDRPSDGDILGYRLTARGDIANPSTAKADEQLSLPDTDLNSYNQGMAWVGSSGDKQCFLLSRSAQYEHTTHSDPPQPTDWPLETILEWTGQLTRWCGNADGGDAEQTIEATLPSGLENIALGPDGTVWTLTENGARYYQRRTNHQEWYPYLSPYVLGIPLSRLGR